MNVSEFYYHQKPDKIYSFFRRLILFLFGDIFSILFYIIFGNVKVLDIILDLTPNFALNYILKKMYFENLFYSKQLPTI
jgi:hypothetical protein